MSIHKCVLNHRFGKVILIPSSSIDFDAISLEYKMNFNEMQRKLILIICRGKSDGDRGPQGQKGEKGPKGDSPPTPSPPTGIFVSFSFL